MLNPAFRNKGMYQLYGESGHGKSRLALSISYLLGTAGSFIGWTAPKPIRVLYVDGELPPQDMDEWLARLGEPTENLRVLSDKRNYDLGLPRVTLATEDGRRYVAQVIERYDPGFIVLDALLTLTVPDLEKDVQAWNEIVPWLEEHHILRGRVILLLHHAGRNGKPFGTSTRELLFAGIMRMERKENLSTDERWAFKLSWFKPRHLSLEQARPRIITANVAGTMDWRVLDEDEAPTVGPQSRAPQQLEQIKVALAEGSMTQQEIADEFGVSRVRISQLKAQWVKEGSWCK